jgi:hypothetical protein
MPVLFICPDEFAILIVISRLEPAQWRSIVLVPNNMRPENTPKAVDARDEL